MVEYRKIIAFGKSSYVVSLPKSWITKNKLEKGDIIGVKDESSHLILTPKLNDVEGEEKSLIIDLSKYENLTFDSKFAIRRLIISSYINGYSVLRFKGKNLNQFVDIIRDSLGRLAGFEILEHTSDNMLVKNYLNLKQVSIVNTVKRMDRITRAMLDDCLLIENEENANSLKQRDSDVNRLFYLSLRTLKNAFNNNQVAMKLNFTINDLLNYWNLVKHIEDAADDAKRYAALLVNSGIDDKRKKELAAVFKRIVENYKKSTDSFFKEDVKLANVVSDNGKETFLLCDSLIDIKSKTTGNLIEIMKSLQNSVRQISRVTLNA